jgi:hypothetical protein
MVAATEAHQSFTNRCVTTMKPFGTSASTGFRKHCDVFLVDNTQPRASRYFRTVFLDKGKLSAGALRLEGWRKPEPIVMRAHPGQENR